jgi:hypothetical protein
MLMNFLFRGKNPIMELLCTQLCIEGESVIKKLKINSLWGDLLSNNVGMTAAD